MSFSGNREIVREIDVNALIQNEAQLLLLLLWPLTVDIYWGFNNVAIECFQAMKLLLF